MIHSGITVFRHNWKSTDVGKVTIYSVRWRRDTKILDDIPIAKLYVFKVLSGQKTTANTTTHMRLKYSQIITLNLYLANERHAYLNTTFNMS